MLTDKHGEETQIDVSLHSRFFFLEEFWSRWCGVYFGLITGLKTSTRMRFYSCNSLQAEHVSRDKTFIIVLDGISLHSFKRKRISVLSFKEGV